MSLNTSDKREAATAILKALAGCRGCEYDEADGALFNHCDKCCRRITTLAWEWAHASRKRRSIAAPTEGHKT